MLSLHSTELASAKIIPTIRERICSIPNTSPLSKGTTYLQQQKCLGHSIHKLLSKKVVVLTTSVSLHHSRHYTDYSPCQPKLDKTRKGRPSSIVHEAVSLLKATLHLLRGISQRCLQKAPRMVLPRGFL